MIPQFNHFTPFYHSTISIINLSDLFFCCPASISLSYISSPSPCSKNAMYYMNDNKTLSSSDQKILGFKASIYYTYSSICFFQAS